MAGVTGGMMGVTGGMMGAAGGMTGGATGGATGGVVGTVVGAGRMVDDGGSEPPPLLGGLVRLFIQVPKV